MGTRVWVLFGVWQCGLGHGLGTGFQAPDCPDLHKYTPSPQRTFNSKFNHSIHNQFIDQKIHQLDSFNTRYRYPHGNSSTRLAIRHQDQHSSDFLFYFLHQKFAYLNYKFPKISAVLKIFSLAAPTYHFLS